MKQSDLIKEYLIAHEWEYKGNCNCGGMHTEKFELKTDAGEYKIKQRYSYFLISTPTKKYKRHELKELKPIVDELFQNNKAVVS